MTNASVTTKQRARVLELATQGIGQTEISQIVDIDRDSVQEVLDYRYSHSPAPDPVERLRWMASRLRLARSVP